MLIEELETSLRAALAERAADVPPAAGSRLRGLDYRPRSLDVRPRVALGALGATASAAAATVAVISLTAGASSAFAGWTTSPSRPSVARLASADGDCKQQLALGPSIPHGPAPIPANATPVLSEARGPFTFLIYAGQDFSASCVTGPGFASFSGSQGSDVGTAPAGEIRLSSQHLTTRDGHEFTLVEGHAGAGVSAATLRLKDSTQVEASISNGWFAAWWPGSADVSSAQVTTPTGIVNEHLSTGGPGPCGTAPGTCSRAGAGVERVGQSSGFGGVIGSTHGRAMTSGSVGTLAP
jgi:hypothetical protein